MQQELQVGGGQTAE